MKRGRPKGHSPYIAIPYEELGDWVGKKQDVIVCRKWLDARRGNIEDDSHLTLKAKVKSAVSKKETHPNELLPKIEYKLTNFNKS